MITWRSFVYVGECNVVEHRKAHKVVQQSVDYVEALYNRHPVDLEYIYIYIVRLFVCMCVCVTSSQL